MSKLKPILIVDNARELQEIEAHYPDLNTAPLVLLGHNFTLNQLASFKDRGYIWFDEYIIDKDIERLSNDINHVLWGWFLNDRGEDISEIDGCSLGTVFAPSLEILLTNIVRYKAGLEKILKPEHTVYCSARTKDIFMDVCAHLSHDIGFAFCPIEHAESNKSINTKEPNRSFDMPGRIKTFNMTFNNNRRWIYHIILKIMVFLQRFQKKKNDRVLITNAGKLDKYIDHISNHEPQSKFSWVIPLSFNFNVVRLAQKYPLFYSFQGIPTNRYDEVGEMITSLRKNIRIQINAINQELLIKIMNRNIFPYFYGALSYFKGAEYIYQAMKIDFAVFSTDTYEHHILAAQAAKKVGVKTALIPHGIYGWGFHQHKKGRFKIFDYCIAFSKKQHLDFNYQRVTDNNIIRTVHPYFERFIYTTTTTIKKYSKALILAPDIRNQCVGEKIGNYSLFFKEVSMLLDDLNIKIIGIKSRHIASWNELGINDDKYKIDGKLIPLLEGYSSFPDAVKDADLVIGPASTAVIEAALLKKDYYVYQHTAFHECTPSILPAIFDYVNGSFSMDQLKENILNKQPYNQGYSVKDLVDLEGIKTKEDIYNKFETTIQEVLYRVDSNTKVGVNG